MGKKYEKKKLKIPNYNPTLIIGVNYLPDDWISFLTNSSTMV